VTSRSVNSFEVVQNAKAAGMRAVVLKNHYVSTAALAQLAMEEVGGIEVYGGIVLNRSNGGINPEAVRRMVEVEGAPRQSCLAPDLRRGESDQV